MLDRRLCANLPAVPLMAAVAPGATALVVRAKKGTGKTIIGVILKALIGPAHSFMASLRLRDSFALAFCAISVVLGAWLLFRPPRQSCRRTKSIHGLRIGRCLHQSGYRGGTEPRPLLSRLAFDPAS